MDNVIVAHNTLKELCAKSLNSVGIPMQHADIVADVLVHANLRGVNSHGVMRMEHYIKRISSGGVNKCPEIKVTRTGPGTAMIDGDDGLGHVVAARAMEVCVELAREVGIGAAGVTNSSHCGALSYYVCRAAEGKMIGFATTHTDSFVVPYGGIQPYFGTNPLAFSFPAKQHDPVVLDMATSTVAYGKILHAAETGKSIPLDWAVDNDGNRVSEPKKAAWLLPFGGAKGYGLGMIADILSGVLTGSPFGTHIMEMYGHYDKMRKLGHFFAVIDPDRFVGRDVFAANMDQMIDEIHAVPPADGFSRVMVPGEPEHILTKERLTHGIPVVKVEYDFLIRAAGQLS